MLPIPRFPLHKHGSVQHTIAEKRLRVFQGLPLLKGYLGQVNVKSTTVCLKLYSESRVRHSYEKRYHFPQLDLAHGVLFPIYLNLYNLRDWDAAGHADNKTWLAAMPQQTCTSRLDRRCCEHPGK